MRHKGAKPRHCPIRHKQIKKTRGRKTHSPTPSAGSPSTPSIHYLSPWAVSPGRHNAVSFPLFQPRTNLHEHPPQLPAPPAACPQHGTLVDRFRETGRFQGGCKDCGNRGRSYPHRRMLNAGDTVASFGGGFLSPHEDGGQPYRTLDDPNVTDRSYHHHRCGRRTRRL